MGAEGTEHPVGEGGVCGHRLDIARVVVLQVVLIPLGLPARNDGLGAEALGVRVLGKYPGFSARGKNLLGLRVKGSSVRVLGLGVRGEAFRPSKRNDRQVEQ